MSPLPIIRPIADHSEYLEAVRVRIRVFVEEQGGPADEEPDEWDAESRHFVVLDGDRIVGTGRLYEPEPRLGKIGRVALLPEYRGRGWGRLLMRALMAGAREAGFLEILVHAQEYAVEFYARLGFVAEGEPFVEAGIPHRKMRLALDETP